MRQFLVANAELGEHGEMARELKNKLTHFLQSVQVRCLFGRAAAVWCGGVGVGVYVNDNLWYFVSCSHH